MSVLPPDDPHGDRAWQAEQRRQKGRGVLLGSEGDDVPDEPGPDESDLPDDEGPPDPGARDPVYRTIRIARISRDGQLSYVPLTLPDDCPVVPLGIDGKLSFFLTPAGQLIDMPAGQMGQDHIEALFGQETDWLCRAFAQIDAQKRWKGFHAQYARMALRSAAARKGVFDARDKVRGLGCWRGQDGQLIQHLGDHVLIGGERADPGVIEGFVYPGRPPIDPPSGGEAARVAAAQVFERVKKWKWARGETDARLLLGWLGCAILGAALKWRPMIFMIGDAGTGKSSLQDELNAMLPGRLKSTVDASPAGLRQILNQDALGVSFDEIEADVLSDQAQMVMKLARVAASGGTVYRGGKDHSAAEFQLRGCFAFSAIVPPSMRQQDMQRFAFLRLQPFSRGDKAPPTLTPAEARALGAALVGRMTGGWSRWEATLTSYKAALEAAGHAKRGAEQFGALLAAAEILLDDTPPAEWEREQLVKPLKRAGMFEYETTEAAWLGAWRAILNAQPEAWRSDGLPSVAEVLRKYLRAARASENGDSGEEGRRQALHDKLTRAGFAMVKRRSGKVFLAVPPKHQAIGKIFAGTDLQARGGDGAWSIVLRGAPRLEGDAGVWCAENVPRLNRAKCTLYWLGATIDGVPIFDANEDGADGADVAVFEDEEASEREPGEDG